MGSVAPSGVPKLFCIISGSWDISKLKWSIKFDIYRTIQSLEIWCPRFLDATAAQEAHLSLRPSVRVYPSCVFVTCNLLATFCSFGQLGNIVCRPTGQTKRMDQFFIFEALAILHIFEDWRFSLYIVTASKCDEGHVFTCISVPLYFTDICLNLKHT